MTDLPRGWGEATVLELAGQKSVVTDGDWVESKDQDPLGSVRLIQLADIGDGFFVNKSQRFMNSETVERLNCTLLDEGDVLIARMPDPLGRACIFPDIGQQAVTAVDVFVWRPDRKLAGAEPRWLMHTINSPVVRSAIQSEAGGTTRQRVAGGKLKQLRLPVPPLAEQRRIVAKVDGLTARTARARKKLDRIPTLIARYKQRLLALAFSGELTGGTEGWQTATIGELADTQLGKMLDKAKNTGEPTRYLRNINVRWFDFQLDDVLEMPMSDEERRKFSIKDGDILTCEGGEPGRSAIWNKGSTDLAFQKALIRIRPDLERLNPSYLVYHFKYLADSQELERHFTGSTIKHLPQSLSAEQGKAH